MDAGSVTSGTGSVASGTGPMSAPRGPDTSAPRSTVHPPRPGRTAVLLGSTIVLLVAIALAVVAITSRPPAEFSPGTPEHAFQAYLAAWDSNDLEGAYARFSDRVRAELTIDEYRDMARGWAYDDGTERRVVLVASTVNGDRATLELRVDEQSGGGLFGGGSVWSRSQMVDLVRDGDTWHLDRAMAGLEPMWYEK